MTEIIASLAVPVIIGIVGLIMLFGKKAYFDAFVAGARDGLMTAVRLLPTLTALIVCISMLTASGVLDIITDFITPAARFLGIPAELVPLLLTRPVSGSASTASYAALLERYGADSFVSFCASVIMGSSDTMLYVISVYFSSVGIRKSRYAIPVALIVMIFCIFFSSVISRLWFKA